MERYTLKELYPTLSGFSSALNSSFTGALVMGLTSTQLTELQGFVSSVIYGYFYDDLVCYTGEDANEVKTILINRLGYDISLKIPYWYKKYTYVKKLLTTNDLSLLQTSKMTSTSFDKTRTASGTLQKTATTPTGVTATGSTDSFGITLADSSSADTDADVGTTGFADKYTNAQQKFANAGRVDAERGSDITREGSIDDLVNVLEKLPSSFADEINKDLQKHFIFDYDGEMKGLYDEL